MFHDELHKDLTQQMADDEQEEAELGGDLRLLREGSPDDAAEPWDSDDLHYYWCPRNHFGGSYDDLGLNPSELEDERRELGMAEAEATMKPKLRRLCGTSQSPRQILLSDRPRRLLRKDWVKKESMEKCKIVSGRIKGRQSQSKHVGNSERMKLWADNQNLGTGRGAMPPSHDKLDDEKPASVIARVGENGMPQKEEELARYCLAEKERAHSVQTTAIVELGGQERWACAFWSPTFIVRT
ncbi:hypothetical protein C8R43DRAFT_958409 [Mycena crocata]|nr:hypothetical protein C8R43DRAFT_958409 [Mycena crocata]